MVYLKGPSFGTGRGRLGDTWHLDEVFMKIRGERHYLWRAVDQDGDVLDILVQPRRDRKAVVFARSFWSAESERSTHL